MIIGTVKNILSTNRKSLLPGQTKVIFLNNIQKIKVNEIGQIVAHIFMNSLF